MTRQLLDRIEACTRNLPAEFLAWLCDRAEPPSKGQLYVVQRAQIPDPLAPSVWMVTFRSAAAFFNCWEAFETALRFGPNCSPPRRSHDCAEPNQHPQQYQYP
jgi:hypothetical protein